MASWFWFTEAELAASIEQIECLHRIAYSENSDNIMKVNLNLCLFLIAQYLREVGWGFKITGVTMAAVQDQGIMVC